MRGVERRASGVGPIDSRGERRQRPRCLARAAGQVPAQGGPRFSDQCAGIGQRRFWETCRLLRLADEASPGKYAVALDGHWLVTPAGRRLLLPGLPLALGVGLEWEAQRERIQPFMMPLTRLAVVATDLDGEAREVFTRELLEFLHTDTVCFGSTEPESLRVHQDRLWRPLLQHMHARYGMHLQQTRGQVTGGGQSELVLQRMREWLDSTDHWTLTGLHSAACAAKSLVIALALRDGVLDSSGALAAARCDEDWQCERYGFVEGDHDVDRALLGVTYGAASVLFRALEGVPEATRKTLAERAHRGEASSRRRAAPTCVRV
eukprot:ctg_129.g95